MCINANSEKELVVCNFMKMKKEVVRIIQLCLGGKIPIKTHARMHNYTATHAQPLREDISRQTKLCTRLHFLRCTVMHTRTQAHTDSSGSRRQVSSLTLSRNFSFHQLTKRPFVYMFCIKTVTSFKKINSRLISE